jgi:hypothetical protein
VLVLLFGYLKSYNLRTKIYFRSFYNSSAPSCIFLILITRVALVCRCWINFLKSPERRMKNDNYCLLKRKRLVSSLLWTKRERTSSWLLSFSFGSCVWAPKRLPPQKRLCFLLLEKWFRRSFKTSMKSKKSHENKLKTLERWVTVVLQKTYGFMLFCYWVCWTFVLFFGILCSSFIGTAFVKRETKRKNWIYFSLVLSQNLTNTKQEKEETKTNKFRDTIW